MTVKGIDAAWDRPTPAEILAAGYQFVCRYVGEDNSGKDISRAEADALSRAGVAIVTNYEYAPGSALRGYAEGRRVAKIAEQEHRAAGGPPDRPIYFSVDVNTEPGDMPAIGAYFDGIGVELGPERVGVYGEYDVVTYLAATRRASWFWQTYAWSGTPPRWYPGAHIRQVRNGIHVAGHDVDEDLAAVLDFGQWMTGEAAMITADDAKAIGKALLAVEVYSSGDPARSHTLQEVLGDLHAAMMGGHTMYGPMTDAWLLRRVDAAATDAAAAAAGAELPIDVENLGERLLAAVFKAAGRGILITPAPTGPAG